MDEFEFRNALVSLQIKGPPGVSRAQRNVLDHFARSQNMRKAKEYPQRVDDHINLACQLLD
jgi:hypothetical protein